MKADQFFGLIKMMRAAQSAYFRSRTQESLLIAKSLEREVDDVLASGLDPEPAITSTLEETDGPIQGELIEGFLETELQARLINAILAERGRQDKKWGADRNLSDETWYTILGEEMGESAEAILKNMPELELEVIQVAAVSLAWLECIERNKTGRTTYDEAKRA